LQGFKSIHVVSSKKSSNLFLPRKSKKIDKDRQVRLLSEGAFRGHFSLFVKWIF